MLGIYPALFTIFFQMFSSTYIKTFSRFKTFIQQMDRNCMGRPRDLKSNAHHIHVLTGVSTNFDQELDALQ